MGAKAGPGSMCPPTLLFVAGLVAAAFLESRESMPLDSAGLNRMQIVAGLASIGLGVGLFLWGLVTFLRARTGIMLQQPASHLVTAGPYGRSRNPQYVGFIACYFGIALLANSLWALILLPCVIGVLLLVVIEREERYLTTIFGDAYENYCRSVRRWI